MKSKSLEIYLIPDVSRFYIRTPSFSFKETAAARGHCPNVHPGENTSQGMANAGSGAAI